jgi:NAD-dependent deacetylase
MKSAATISFGQPMPETAMRRTSEQTTLCDVFLAIASSLVVCPAADFAVLAKEHGARLIIINCEPTSLDFIADLVINAEIGRSLDTAVGIE